MPYCTCSRVYTFCKESAQNNSGCIAKLFAVVRVKGFLFCFFVLQAQLISMLGTFLLYKKSFRNFGFDWWGGISWLPFCLSPQEAILQLNLFYKAPAWKMFISHSDYIWTWNPILSWTLKYFPCQGRSLEFTSWKKKWKELDIYIILGREEMEGRNFFFLW